MRVANIRLYVNIAVYIHYYVVCLNRLYTYMLRINVFSIFIVKSPGALTTLAPLGLFIVKTLTNVL